LIGEDDDRRLQPAMRGRHAIPTDMTRRLQEMARFSAFVGLLAALACAPAEGPGGWIELAPASNDASVIRIVGTVRHLDVEGGQFVIADEVNGRRFSPMNLPDSVQVDGTRVEADARRRAGTVSAGMVGPIVELIRIRVLPLP
jgi:hypothetical protein